MASGKTGDIASGEAAMSVTLRPFRNGGWEVDVLIQLPDGIKSRVRKKAPVSTKSGALRWGQALERELLIRKPIEPREEVEVPTLAAFQPRYIEGYARANRQKPSGISSKEAIFKNHLVPLLGNKRLNEIRNEDVQRLKASFKDKSAKTTNNVLSVLNSTLKAACEWNVIGVMPCSIKLLKTSAPEMSFYDFEQYEALVEAAEKVGQRELLIVLLGGEAGLRLGEMIALEQTDIDFRRGYLTVQRNEWHGQVGLPKGGRIRRIPMTKRLAKALHENRHLKGPRVLYRNDGSTVTRHVLRSGLKSVERRAGLDSVGALHILRHTFCSHLAMKGAPTRAIQELAGHKDITTTQRYMHLSPAAIESAIRLLDGQRTDQNRGDIVETLKPKSPST